MWTKAFWKAAAERAVRGAAVAALAIWTAAGVDIVGGVDFTAVAWAALVGAVGSLLLSLAGNQINDVPGPSLTGTEETVPPAVPVPDQPARDEVGVGEGKYILLVTCGVLLALLLFFVVFPALGNDDNNGKRGNDWERNAIGARL